MILAQNWPMWPGFDSRTRRHYVGWVYVGSRPCSEGFSPGTPVLLPQQKPTRSLFELAVGCAPRSCMDRTAAASGAYICFRSDLVKLRPCCTLRGRLARQLLLLLFFDRTVSKTPKTQAALTKVTPCILLFCRGDLALATARPRFTFAANKNQAG